MSCNKPIDAWQYTQKSKSQSLQFGTAPHGELTKEMQISCRQCKGCLIDRSIMWAIRMMHESSLHEHNQFITLSYDQDNIPENYGLHKRDHQLFMKRLRRHFKNTKIRYFVCGEYGEETSRPHYHLILFNLPLTDLVPWSEKKDHKTYTSQIINKIWAKGNCIIGESVTPQTCAYVSNYMLKELRSKNWKTKFAITDPTTGEYHERIPPYQSMSRRPGLAADWYKNFSTDVFPDDFIVVEGNKRPTPTYYLNLLKAENPDLHDQIKLQRERSMESEQFQENSTPERLHVREQCKTLKINQSKRNQQ